MMLVITAFQMASKTYISEKADINGMSLNERRTYDVAVLDALAASWRGFCMRKRRDNRQWRKFGVKRCFRTKILSNIFLYISFVK